MKTNSITNQKSKITFFISLLIIMCFSCGKDDNIEEQMPLSEEATAEINKALAGLSEFSQESEITQPELLEESVLRNDVDKSQECTTEMYKAAPGYDEMLALDPSSEVIYPGAMLKGESIPPGEYIGINGGRAPITLSISLENLNGKPSVEIDDPKLSTVREGIKDLLQQGVTGATAAELVFETKQVYSEEHLNLALGANYRSAGKSVSTSFNFNSSEYKYKYLIKYLQIYYTIDIDLPANENPAALFTDLPTLNSTSPVIVSSVKYGRMVLYTVESNYSQTDVQGAFNASFGSSDGSVEASYEKILSESSIKGIVIGGSGKDAAKVVEGPQGVYNYITEGGNFSADSPAAPLAYTLRYIREDFPIARVVLTSEYPVRTCYEAYQKFAVEIYGFNCVDNDNESGKVEIFGSMKGQVFQDGVEKGSVSWSVNRDNALGVDEDFFFEIKNKSIVVELYKPDLSSDYILLTTTFSERDLASDDYFGKVEHKILLKDVNPNKTKSNYVRINLQEDYQSDMRAYFYAYRLSY